MTDGADNSNETRTVYLVGAGPGDAGLITVKAMQLLESADVVVYDALANPDLLLHARRDALLIAVGKRATRHTVTQDQINATLVEHALAGRRVVRLKGGDPFVFGRGAEEAIHLHEHGVRCEIVPGVPAAIACAAYAGIPLTHRNLATAAVFVTGHEATGKDQPQLDYEALAKLGRDGATLCIYMGMFRLTEIMSKLIEHGMTSDTPAAVVRWGTLTKQQSLRTTLGNLAADVERGGLRAPAMIYIGPVVGVDPGGALDWFESRPLFGKTVMVTRTRDQASHLRGLLEEAGANVLEAPTIEITPLDNSSLTDAALREMPNYDWLLLTSANGVRAMRTRLHALGLDARQFAGVKIGAVGSSTAAALAEMGLCADLAPDEFIAQALGEALIAGDNITGKRILLMRGDLAGVDLPWLLTEAGAQVADLPVYQNRPASALPEDVAEALEAGLVDWITFTSSSTVSNLHSLLGNKSSLLQSIKTASIGPKTSETARGLGLDVTCEADPRTMAGMVAAIIATEA